MRYLDVCAGISASTVAWKPLGWEAAAYSEIEAAPRAVLAHHYPDTPLHGDFTTIRGDEYGAIDLLVGGTPCQDFSVAGLRAGLDGDRGNLSLEFLRLADRARPRWVVWENVPGVLSIDGGRAFGAILGGLGELGYGFAYRVLDAQFFGVPQRRRRVFVVGCLGDWRGAAAVLSERHSLSGHPAPRRQAREGFAERTAFGISPDCFDRSGEGAGGTAAERSGLGVDHEIAYSLRAKRAGGVADVAHALRGEGFDASEDGTGRGTPLVPVCIPIDMRQASRGATMTNNRAEGSSGGAPGTGIGNPGDPAPTVSTSHVAAVAFAQNSRDEVRLFGGDGGTVGALGAEPGMKQQCYVATTAVRRLTPRECERLQGFPDDYTLVPHRGKPMADGPRYKALGNSMAVPVMAFIGQRIQMVEDLLAEKTIAA
ncbi:DNA cytosine methyltransferase [Sphingomonas melonis]|uniref:Cytosine-specific methyltransferase n=1 Tax=Sphingomonas melonis TaxID=152682 RepID=A0A7Y9FMC6_9SPHN|nr:DNA (cytosine-5)-methyltransferase 1 [Sphingomonas melonis]